MTKFYQLTLILLISLFGNDMMAQCFPTQTYTTPGTYNYTAPGTGADTYVIEIEARGGDGGDFLWGGNPQSDGGEGATMRGSFTVIGGDQFFIVVGQSGNDALGSPGGGGGGGGSAVVINSTEVLIAAAAGGGGGQNTEGEGAFANTNSPAQGGGAPGASGGGGFNSPGQSGANSTGGGAGTLTSQGLGGSQGVVAGPGGNGFGGGGGGAGTGGGGGGGYQGGDGAANGNLNGKGGDSFITTLYSGAVIQTTAGQTGGGFNVNGSVTIECTSTMVPDLDINIQSQTDPSCAGDVDGSITVQGIGGDGNYQFSINGGSQTSNTIFDNLEAGAYTIEVEDGTGATETISTNLTDPPALTGVTIQVLDNECFDSQTGVIEVLGQGGTVSGSYQYRIDGGPFQSNGFFDNLTTGPHLVEIFDDNNCTYEILEDVFAPDEIIVQIITQDDITCFGANDGQVQVFADGGNGGITYSLNNTNFQASDIFVGLGPDNYTVTALDNTGCTGTNTFTITEPDLLEVIVSSFSDVSCNGNTDGEVDLQGFGGTTPRTFSMDNLNFQTSGVFTNLSSGTFTFYIKDANDCISTVSQEIQEPQAIVLTVDSKTDAGCGGAADGSVNLSAMNGTGMYTYSLNGISSSTGEFMNIPAGTYIASVVDLNGCSSEITVTINQAADITVSAIQSDSLSCFGDSNASIVAMSTGGNGPITYSINGGAAIINNIFPGLSAGLYIIEAIDSLACSNTDTVEISQPSEVTSSAIITNTINCNGNNNGAVDIQVAGGTSGYTVSLGGQTLTLSMPGTLTFSGLASNTYTYTISDQNACMSAGAITLNEPVPLLAEADTIIAADCLLGTNGSVTLSASGGTGPYTYILGDTSLSGEFTDVIAGNYTASVIDANGCRNEFSVDVTQTGGLNLDNDSIVDVLCFGDNNGSITVNPQGGSGNYTFTLDGGTPSMSGTFDNLAANTYTLLVEDDLGCQSQKTIVIGSPDELVSSVDSINHDNGSMTGYIRLLTNGGTKPYRYSIDRGATSQESNVFEGLAQGSYTITIIDVNGCESEIDVNIFFTSNKEIDLGISDLNLFPNPSNGLLNIEFVLDESKNLVIDIYTIQGEKLLSKSYINLNTGQQRLRLDLDELSSGTYLLKGKTSKGIFNRKLLLLK